MSIKFIKENQVVLQRVLFILLFGLILFVAGCADDGSKELESVEVHFALASDAADTYCIGDFDASADQYHQFYLVGYYDDDSTENLSDEDEMTWSKEDTSGDSALSSFISGLLLFDTTGTIILQGSYTVQTSSSSSSETDDNILSDAVIIEVKSSSCN